MITQISYFSVLCFQASLEPDPTDRPTCTDLLRLELFDRDGWSERFLDELRVLIARETSNNPLLREQQRPHESTPSSKSHSRHSLEPHSNTQSSNGNGRQQAIDGPSSVGPRQSEAGVEEHPSRPLSSKPAASSNLPDPRRGPSPSPPAQQHLIFPVNGGGTGVSIRGPNLYVSPPGATRVPLLTPLNKKPGAGGPVNTKGRPNLLLPELKATGAIVGERMLSI